MPRFYFDSENIESLFRDTTGSDFPNEKAALNDAREAARQLAGERLKHNERLRGRAIVVRDEAGNFVERFRVDLD